MIPTSFYISANTGPLESYFTNVHVPLVTLVFRHACRISLFLPRDSPESAYLTMTLRTRISSAAARVFGMGFLLCLFSSFGTAANTRATAIELYDSASGPAYVQILGLTINGKMDMRICDDLPKFDKRAYDLMVKTQIAGASSLERGADGKLTLTVNSKPVCVVPNGLKFDKTPAFTPAEAAEQAIAQGLVVSSSVQGAGIAPIKPGVKFVFVTAPDDELAEFLLAQRANSIAVWQGFLSRFPTSTRATDAKNAIAAIHEASAETAFAEYRKSSAPKSDLGRLKQAEEQAELAESFVAGYAPAHQLREQISKEIEGLLEADRDRLHTFRKALSGHAAGFTQLLAARQHTEQLLEINAQYAPLVKLHSEITGEVHKADSTIENAESLLAAKRYDEALTSLGEYRAFAAEAPRIEAIISADYAFHFARGQEYSRSQAWEQAAAEFRKAENAKPESQESSAALKNIELQLVSAQNREAAEAAIATSSSYAQKNQYVEAYEVLANLPAAQQKYVSDQLTELQKNYVTAASRRALKLEEIHLPIRGRADEDAVCQAYDLLNRASAISGDPALKLKLDVLSDKISAYYMEQARRYLEKPMGSGVGLGWMYLAEAQHYKANLETVSDMMAKYSPAYQLHSRLSVGVVMRDQTSRRDSVGFADQMRDSIATGLESSGLSIKVVRQSSEMQDQNAVQPNFLLVGEILEHRVVKNVSLETLPSKYRAATHEVKNEAWLQANQDNEAAQQQLAAAQRELSSAQALHKKKEVVAAESDAVTAAQKQVADARQKLETTEQTRTENVLEPYNYTKRNIDLSAIVDMAFRITDQAGNPIETSLPIRKEDHKLLVVLDNVKPEDTQGVKKQGTEPDEVQFLTDQEIQARDAMMKAVREKAILLPSRILSEARRRAQQSDFDGAAEEYILYANAVGDSPSQERDEAAKFLHDHFNLGPAGGTGVLTESRLHAMN